MFLDSDLHLNVYNVVIKQYKALILNNQSNK